jgi:BASS family bile acid:Na+ symporter
MTPDAPPPLRASALSRACLFASAAAAATLAAGLIAARPGVWQPAAVALAVSIPFTLRTMSALRGYQFTAWIVAAVVAAMIYPQRILHTGSLDLGNKLLILTIVQLVMFGMGTQMSLRDFAGIARMPWSVLVGIFCQFTIMPLTGFALTKAFPLPDEVAAGVILIGCCSSGLASNVMAYLARANLALSITMTSVTTILAPLMTPLWMKLLAGDRVEISMLAMMADIIKLVIVPIGAALLHDFLKHATTRGRRSINVAAALGAVWLTFIAFGDAAAIPWSFAHQPPPWLSLLNYLVGALVVGVVFHRIVNVAPAVERWMPVASMFGIVYFTAVATAKGRDELLAVGGLLFVAAIIHNALGYLLGYWMSRALGVDRTAARTVTFEVGLQNGGMATGIANSMDKLGTMGLAAAVFSPWMNVSGSILANYWRKRPVGGADQSDIAIGCEPQEQGR